MDDSFDPTAEFRIDGAHPRPGADAPDAADAAEDQPPESWLDEDIEAAYRQALEANEAVEEEIGPGVELTEWSMAQEPDGVTDSAGQADTETGFEAADREAEPEVPRVTARQVIEAILFVGGKPVTAKKLAGLVGPDSDKSMVEEEIEALNAVYHGEDRPYEIRLAEGGYRLQLREEFEPIRNRVFGLGPKEVKLSQEQLEVLALVAYKQPISRQEIEQHGRKNAGGMLRQLLRRQLIVIERGNNPRRDITYRTTPRFLEVFNLREIEDLPTPEELETR